MQLSTAAVAALLLLFSGCGGGGSHLAGSSNLPSVNPPPTGGGGTGGGGGASIAGKQVFPATNPWNQDISGQPVDPNSANLIASIGLTTGLHPDFGTVWNGAPIGIPYVVVSGTQAKVPVTFDYTDESDPGPYPIPADAPIEGGSSSTGDRHILV